MLNKLDSSFETNVPYKGKLRRVYVSPFSKSPTGQATFQILLDRYFQGDLVLHSNGTWRGMPDAELQELVIDVIIAWFE